MTGKGTGKGKYKGACIAFAFISITVYCMFFLIYYLRNKQTETPRFTLTENGVVNEALDVSLEGWVPSEEREYTLDFDCVDAGTYRFSFMYVAKESSPLGEYVTVYLIENEEVKASGTLAQLFAGNALVAICTAQKDEVCRWTVRYAMADTLGNELQGVGIDFDLSLTVEKIG